MSDERILKKVGKLLELYGVSEEEKDKFLIDLQDKKYDEEEEQPETPTEQKPLENEEQETSQEQEQVEETTETENEESGENKEVAETESEETIEENSEEEPPTTENESLNLEEESNVEEQNQPETSFDAQAKFEEVTKSIDGLASRIQSVEDLIAKLGVPAEEKPFGAKSSGNPVDENVDTSFDEINRKRLGY